MYVYLVINFTVLAASYYHISIIYFCTIPLCVTKKVKMMEDDVRSGRIIYHPFSMITNIIGYGMCVLFMSELHESRFRFK